jgi:hypothetical protein
MGARWAPHYGPDDIVKDTGIARWTGMHVHCDLFSQVGADVTAFGEIPIPISSEVKVISNGSIAYPISGDQSADYRPATPVAVPGS